MSDLARQLAAHPRWRWEPGILACDPVGGGSEFVTVETLVPNAERHAHRIPDIHHPATRGWLLEMLREATLDPGAHVAQMMPLGTQPGGWAVYSTRPLPAAPGATEGEALAAALLAVWGAA